MFGSEQVVLGYYIGSSLFMFIWVLGWITLAFLQESANRAFNFELKLLTIGVSRCEFCQFTGYF